MNLLSFSLQPFPQSLGMSFDFALQGQCSRQANRLKLCYELTGNWQAIALPRPSPQPHRQDNLWQSTCFELFLGAVGDLRYWEFNLSPSGDWNVYRFADYRQGMESEMAWDALPFALQLGGDRLRLDLDLDLSRLNLLVTPLEMGITAVIQEKNRRTSYWALTHTENEPNFHRRESFILRLP